MPTKVLYHGNCPDGFAAAWAAWMSLGDKAEYVACQYGHEPPEVDGCDVFIVDFSFKRPVMLELARKAKSVTVLDHHVTAQEDLAGLEAEAANVLVVFDMDKSGATLSWQHFHGSDECWLVDYAEDRDLWRHKLPRTKEVNAYLMAAPKTFGHYSAAFSAGAEQVANWGTGCLTFIRYFVDAQKALATRARFLGHSNIPVVNTPYVSTSEVVGELAEDALFAVGWHVREDGQAVYSLRSRGDFNVAHLAESMGGGGHVRAAGFRSQWMPWALADLTPTPNRKDART
jgi:hypothetical protein